MWKTKNGLWFVSKLTKNGLQYFAYLQIVNAELEWSAWVMAATLAHTFLYHNKCWTETHSELSQIYLMELCCKTTKNGYFGKKYPS